MFLSSLAVLLFCFAALLSWQVFHLKQENAELRTELSKLRGRLRILSN